MQSDHDSPATPDDDRSTEFDHDERDATVELPTASQPPVSVSRGSGTFDLSQTSDLSDSDDFSDTGKTAPAGSQESTVELAPHSSRLPDRGAASILASCDITATVNPRELSGDDVTAWSLAVGGSTEQSVLTRPDNSPPGSDRNSDTYTARRIRRLRRVDVAALQSDTSAEFDYRLVRKLGQGGMGDVFVARQGSLDRLLALKLIKPLSGQKRDQLERTGRLQEVEEERRQQFLAEAIVTGDLDHPNIVPIHDVGLTSDNHLFYAMKRVVGTPWSEVLKDKSVDENLEILLKAADAVAFAHARGVVHRDIKPENIMLGDFGVVMVMDWGLALLTSDYEKQDSIMTSSGLGGTPAFMAPEMAVGPLSRIGKSADIYLLGATLFMIVTGKPPHGGKNVSECLRAVRENEIRQVPPHLHGELLDIALKAMATDPAERYQSVEELQGAVRQYRARAESISLASRAADDLQYGSEHRAYADLSRAAFRFEEALKSWPGNLKAQQGLAQTKWVHAQAAYQNGDYDLGLSLLDSTDPEHALLIGQLRAGLEERESRTRRLSLLRKVATAMLAFIMIGGTVAMFVINRQRSLALSARDAEIAARAETELARQRAERAYLEADGQRALAEMSETRAQAEKREAEKQRAEAIAQQQEADRQQAIAERERANAVSAQQQAERARDQATAAQQAAVASQARAEYEEYVSKIGLAKARLERDEADGAREILRAIREDAPARVRTWEWRWLWRQAHQSTAVRPLAAPLTDLSLIPSGRAGVASTADGGVVEFGLDPAAGISLPTPVSLPATTRAESIALSPNGQLIAVGTATGDIVLLESQATGKPPLRTLSAHRAEVTDLQFASDRWLLSGSRDRTVRWWNVDTGDELTAAGACWHLAPVRQLAVAATPAALTVAVAAADDRTGRIVLWNLQWQRGAATISPIGTFSGHSHPVTVIAISPDGRQAASGDAAGGVRVWNVSDAEQTDYAQAIRDAIAGLESAAKAKPDETTAARRLFDPALAAALPNRAADGRVQADMQPQVEAHADAIRSIRFNFDGSQLLTTSEDHTLKLWKTTPGALTQTLRGHGGWVVAAEFVSQRGDQILSASNDQTLRTWTPETYVGSFVRHQPAESAATASDRTTAHPQPLTGVALSPAGTHVVTASADHTARVLEIDPQTGRFTEVARLADDVLAEGSEFVAMSAWLDHPRRRLYLGNADATVRVWDLDRAVQLGAASHTGLNTALAVSAKGDWLLTGSSLPDAKALLWRLDPDGNLPPQLIHRLGEHDQAVTALAISPDARLVFTGDRMGRGILWDVDSGRPIGAPLDQLRGFRINAAQFTLDGAELLLGGDDQQVTRVRVSDGQIVSRLPHDGAVVRLALHPDARHVVTLSERINRDQPATTATLWDLHTGQPLQLDQVDGRDRGQGARIKSVGFDPSGTYVAVTRAGRYGAAAEIRMWSLAQPTLIAAIAPSRRGSGEARLVPRASRAFRLPPILGDVDTVLPIDGDSLLTLNQNGAFRWRLSDQRLIHSYRAHAALTEAAFSFDSQRIITASRSVKIWDAASGQALGKIESPHIGPVRSVDFAPVAAGPTGFLIATGGDDGVARLWAWNETTKTFTAVQQYDTAVDACVIRRVRFSGDGGKLLIVGDGGVARTWDYGADHAIHLDQADSGDFTCGAFAQGDQHVAVGSSDGRIRLWRLPPPGAPLEEPTLFSTHADVVRDVTLIGSTDADLRLLSASADDTARLWDPRLTAGTSMGRELLSLRRHEGDVTAIDATADGELVVTAGRDGAVILWPAGP